MVEMENLVRSFNKRWSSTSTWFTDVKAGEMVYFPESVVYGMA